jgi:hypothetical protein
MDHVEVFMYGNMCVCWEKAKQWDDMKVIGWIRWEIGFWEPQKVRCMSNCEPIWWRGECMAIPVWDLVIGDVLKWRIDCCGVVSLTLRWCKGGDDVCMVD